MTLSEPGVESRKASMRPLTRFAWLTLAYNIAVILWGAYVRATGSGAGCGNRWPLCNGTVLPRTPQAQTIIEFTHRLTSALAVVMVSSLLVWCWRKTSKGDWARCSSVLAILLLFNEALLGALLVLFEHVGQDRSPARVFFLCMHFGNTLLLLAALALTAHWLSEGHRRSYRSHLCSMANPEKLEEAGATVESRGDACWSSDWADWSGHPERALAGSRVVADRASARR